VSRLEGGDINLVAAHLHLDREHPNRLVFGPEAGLDPMLDVVLVGSELRVLINGRASNWLNNVVITSSRTRAAASGATPRCPRWRSAATSALHHFWHRNYCLLCSELRVTSLSQAPGAAPPDESLLQCTRSMSHHGRCTCPEPCTCP